jgi:hypothetical protein
MRGVGVSCRSLIVARPREPWLEECMQYKIRFVMRWRHPITCCATSTGSSRKPGKSRGANAESRKRQLYNRHLHAWVQGGVGVVPVTHPEVRGPFWLVVSRPGKGQLPWYRLPNEPIQTAEDAWHVVFAYARRWQIELTWRYTKSEFGFESPRWLPLASACQTAPDCEFGLCLPFILA